MSRRGGGRRGVKLLRYRDTGAGGAKLLENDKMDLKITSGVNGEKEMEPCIDGGGRGVRPPPPAAASYSFGLFSRPFDCCSIFRALPRPFDPCRPQGAPLQGPARRGHYPPLRRFNLGVLVGSARAGVERAS